VSGSAGSAGPEWNVAHVDHSSVAGLTLHSKTSLTGRFGQYSRWGVAAI
jgi:hypothetical protein